MGTRQMFAGVFVHSGIASGGVVSSGVVSDETVVSGDLMPHLSERYFLKSSPVFWSFSFTKNMISRKPA